jgi:restriction system protein
MWEVRIRHKGLKAFRVIKGQTQVDADMKAAAQIEIWNQRWARQLAAEKNRHEKMSRAHNVEQSKAEARTLSTECNRQIIALESLLKSGLERGIFFKWEDLKDRTPFSEPAVATAELSVAPPEPWLSSFRPNLSVLDKILSSRRLKKENLAKESFEQAHSHWKALCLTVEDENRRATERDKKLRSDREERKKQHATKQAEQHAFVDANMASFIAGTPEVVEYFFSEVLIRSEYPESFPEEARLQYKKGEGVLVVDYELPNATALPTCKEVKYIATRNTLQEALVSDAWLKKTYDDVLYQIALRSLYELFTHDVPGLLRNIVFNGWVRSIDKATGMEAHACVMSIQAERKEFMGIRLDQVEPKACFRKLKGIASSKLVELMPIRPVISISRKDERFVDSYAVLGSVDDRTNLASMDWLDFENLIREVFEKEFSKNGGEVKITQASRDGGVDAIAFDPDPIRGGKIVIQAKRYTNVVGVAAVRDLYGTVHNEGATKGILVTTSNYGPDAYEFAKGKPLTLLSGSELLYLLEQHGHKSKIDLAAARLEYRESQK